MNISKRGIDILKKLEGFREKAYQDIGGRWTIGYGSTHRVKEGDTITEGEAESRLIGFILKAEWAIGRLVKVPLTQHQFDALVCFIYNIGIAGFEDSTLLKLLNAGEYNQVPHQLMRWTRVNGVEDKGLINRRKQECDLWNGWNIPF